LAKVSQEFSLLIFKGPKFSQSLPRVFFAYFQGQKFGLSFPRVFLRLFSGPKIWPKFSKSFSSLIFRAQNLAKVFLAIYSLIFRAQNLAGFSDPSNTIYLQTSAPHSGDFPTQGAFLTSPLAPTLVGEFGRQR
jgi:hypothetical protein